MLEGDLRFVIFQQILNELESKKRREPNSANFSRWFDSGLLYLENNKNEYNIEIKEDTKDDNETTDDFLIKMSIRLKKKNHNLFLATNDSNLRKKAKKNNIRTIFLRQKKFLSLA